MKITVETTNRYIVEFDDTDKNNLCLEVSKIYSDGFPTLKALQTILENPENR